MGKAIGGSLPLAVGIALSPIPIIAVVLMLTSRKARVNGPAFILPLSATPASSVSAGRGRHPAHTGLV